MTETETADTDAGTETDHLSSFVLETVSDLSTPDDPWTSPQAVVQEGRTEGYDKAALKSTLARLVADEQIFSWHGPITAMEDDVLRGVIEHELEQEEPRKIMIGVINRILRGDGR
jgi:hypothetical protein